MAATLSGMFPRGESFGPGYTGLNYSATAANNKLTVMSNLLSMKHDFSFFRADLKLSHSYSESSNPEDLNFNFEQAGTTYPVPGDGTGIDPRWVAAQIVHNEATSLLSTINTWGSISNERTLQGSLDLSKDIALSTELST